MVKLDVHLGHDAHGRTGEGDVGAVAAGDLARVRVEGEGADVAVDALGVDLITWFEGATAPRKLARTSWQAKLDGACGHPSWREAEDEPAEATASVECGATTTFLMSAPCARPGP